MTAAKEVTAASQYRKQALPETEEVEVTNGFVFTMRKRGIYSVVFGAAQLPQALGSGAVEEWVRQGLIQPNDLPEEKKANINYSMSIVERVLENSISPKIVRGEPKNANEISVSEISDDDLEILFLWQAGGKASEKLARFSRGAQPGTVARPNRKKQRSKAK